MQYKPFETTRNKLEKTWNTTQANQTEIEQNIARITFDFSSINFQKQILEIPILSHYRYSFQERITFELTNTPDWAINNIRPLVEFFLDTGYNPTQQKNSFSQEFQNGTLQTGDITINQRTNAYWYVKKGNTYIFTIRLEPTVSSATVTQFGFLTTQLPVYVNLKLVFFNEKTYKSIQSGK